MPGIVATLIELALSLLLVLALLALVIFIFAKPSKLRDVLTVLLPWILGFFGLFLIVYGVVKLISYGPFLGAICIAAGILLLYLLRVMTSSGSSGGH